MGKEDRIVTLIVLLFLFVMGFSAQKAKKETKK